MSIETTPLFFMRGETIVDVRYIEVEVRGYDVSMVGETNVPVTALIDRIIWETPLGCMEWNLWFAGGNTIHVGPGDGTGVRPTPCQRIRPAQELVSAETH